MCHLCTGCSRRECGAACIGEEIQHFYRTSCIADLIREPFPVRRLFREQSGVFEIERLQVKGQIFIMNLPLLREIEELPFSTAFFAAVIVRIPVLPSFLCLRGIPDHLRIRAHKEILPPPFQFLPVGRINHFIVFPSICNPHMIISFLYLIFVPHESLIRKHSLLLCHYLFSISKKCFQYKHKSPH